jgi:hypothetical protein
VELWHGGQLKLYLYSDSLGIRISSSRPGASSVMRTGSGGETTGEQSRSLTPSSVEVKSVELYLHYPTRLHGVLFHYRHAGTNAFFTKSNQRKRSPLCLTKYPAIKPY